jgi:hypothetical protein
MDHGRQRHITAGYVGPLVGRGGPQSEAAAPRPGDLDMVIIRIDAHKRTQSTTAGARLARFTRPGHFAHGDRAERHRSRGADYLFAHCVADDRSRLVCVRLHPDQRGETCAGGTAPRLPALGPPAAR